MLSAKMKSISSRLVKDRFVRELSPDSHLGLGEGGLKKTDVPESRFSAVSPEKIGMYNHYKFPGQETDGHYFARALRAFLYFLFVRSYAVAHSANLRLNGVMITPSSVSTRWSSSPSLYYFDKECALRFYRAVGHPLIVPGSDKEIIRRKHK
jgi:hypothetical protein